MLSDGDSTLLVMCDGAALYYARADTRSKCGKVCLLCKYREARWYINPADGEGRWGSQKNGHYMEEKERRGGPRLWTSTHHCPVLVSFRAPPPQEDQHDMQLCTVCREKACGMPLRMQQMKLGTALGRDPRSTSGRRRNDGLTTSLSLSA